MKLKENIKKNGTYDENSGELRDAVKPNGVLLILEDYDAIRAFYSSHFEKRGFEVFSAARLADAIELAELEEPAIIIVDYDLAGESADKVVSRLRRHSPKSKIVVLGGLAHQAVQESLKKAGADDYLSKAYDVELVDLIAKRA